MTWLDDHSRYALLVTAHHRVTGLVVLATFREAVAAHGVPASTLTDNGMVFTTRFSGGKGGRNHLEHELRDLHITQKNGQPNHPQTQGKVERFQQTMKTWLRAQPAQPTTISELQTLLEIFEADRPVVDAIHGIADARGVPMAPIALAWLLSKPVVSCPIVGATKPKHLDDAVAAWK